MENKLDKLFRDKLEQHTIQPSDSAWGRVSPLAPEGRREGLSKPTVRSLNIGAGVPPLGVRGPWAWRIAAGVALIGFIGWYAFDSSAGKELPVAKETPTLKKEEVIFDANKLQDKKAEKKKTIDLPKQKILPDYKKPMEPIPLAKIEKEETLQETATRIIAIASVEEATENAELVTPKAQTPEKTRVFVYSLATVVAKPEVKVAKTSGFKKVIEFAKDVKGGETTLASVRDWKDNFFGSDESTRVERQNNN